MGVFAALGRSGRTLVSPLHFLGLLVFACLPREDLASYSISGGIGGAAQGPLVGGNAGRDAGVEPTVPSGEGNPPNLPLNPDGMGSLAGGDAAASALDAGEPPDAATPGDGGLPSLDAGPAANECAAAQGSLVEANVCLIFVSTARVSWQAASLGCQTRNASLVSVKTLERDGILSSLIDTDIWLGGFDPGTNPGANDFLWRDLTEVDTEMATWAANEPDAVADQFCVSKSAPAAGGQWRDAPCSELKAYVCEQTL